MKKIDKIDRSLLYEMTHTDYERQEATLEAILDTLDELIDVVNTLSETKDLCGCEADERGIKHTIEDHELKEEKTDEYLEKEVIKEFLKK